MSHEEDTLPRIIVEPIVANALREDLGTAGDITSRTVLPAGLTARAVIRAREQAVVSGMEVAATAFRLTDPGLEIAIHITDGHRCRPGDVLLEVAGSAHAILAAERVALNFAGRMSGIATLTAAFVEKVAGTRARITCTRKTTPGLRALEKLAVRHGGGFNHRHSLADAILIKDNHIAAAGGIRPVLESVKARVSHMVAVEIEVDSLEQLEEVLEVGGATAVLLDNMPPGALREAVRMVAGRMVTEASGNVTLETVAEIAATGVDYISSGRLTHSAPTVDLGLDM